MADITVGRVEFGGNGIVGAKQCKHVLSVEEQHALTHINRLSHASMLSQIRSQSREPSESLTSISDGVGHPSHYSRYTPEPIEVIEGWGLNFHLGNVLKYIVRASHKGTEIRDLEKAAWYLARWIEIRKGQVCKPKPQV